jgi:hypothetical protein
MKVSIAGIPWYREGDYVKLLSIFEDADNLPGTFNEWLVKAEAFEKNLTKSGMRVVRAVIDPDTFPVWCAANNVKINADGRKRFASHKARETAIGRNN